MGEAALAGVYPALVTTMKTVSERWTQWRALEPTASRAELVLVAMSPVGSEDALGDLVQVRPDDVRLRI